MLNRQVVDKKQGERRSSSEPARKQEKKTSDRRPRFSNQGWLAFKRPEEMISRPFWRYSDLYSSPYLVPSQEPAFGPVSYLSANIVIAYFAYFAFLVLFSCLFFSVLLSDL